MATCRCSYCSRSTTPIDRVSDRLLDTKAQQAFFGVSHMWLKRRETDPEARFPKAHYAGRRPLRWASDLAAWLESPHTHTPSSNWGTRAAEAADAAE